MNIFKGSAHGILSAYCGNAKLCLSLQRAEQSRQRLAPAFFAVRAFEILLEGQINVLKGSTRRHKLANRFDNGKIGAVIGAFFGYKRIISEGHERAVVCVLFLHRNFLNHGLNGGELIFSAEGHEHRSRTDGGVKALGKTSF